MVIRPTTLTQLGEMYVRSPLYTRHPDIRSPLPRDAEFRARQDTTIDSDGDVTRVRIDSQKIDKSVAVHSRPAMVGARKSLGGVDLVGIHLG
jgi:hypothetical protein